MRAGDLTVPFVARDRAGAVVVSVESNAAPSELGCPDVALDFPVCTAEVSFDGGGYDGLFGWVQLVGEGDPASTAPLHYSIDQFPLFERSNLPYGFFGIAPTLFDAPWRSDRSSDLAWRAESYLCRAPSDPMARDVLPIVAFDWGFEMIDGAVDVHGPSGLPLDAWNRHVPLLEASHPGWRFVTTSDD